ncbi:hypothetical protein [uncultured Psychroserpens sp.]|uniref:hypothetical protein n=1 Tax=uncultured Psychroserpens sp. TaxID=255436 RepID=UPI00261E0F1B|nr:hypothetical protein [uncultured Psychroserpens sp.]
MRKKIILAFWFITSMSFSQSEGQTFCGGDPEAPYFTLHRGTKYVVWENTYYAEKKMGMKTIDGVEYVQYNQSW